jgi:outer membrane protein assembly factor BamB
MKRFGRMGTLAVVPALLLFATGCKIEIVPAVAEHQGKITILGSGFGLAQGEGYVSFLNGPDMTEVRDVDRWSFNEIELTLPPEVRSGTVRVHAAIPLLGEVVSDGAFLQVMEAGLPSEPYGYEVPVQEDSPWPSFRRDRKNSGHSPVTGAYDDTPPYNMPWSFQTEKGIFSTPILDADGTVYVGSADHNFYAIHPDGKEKWRFQTGELIDSAATITRKDPALGTSKVVFLSGDGNIYCLRSDNAEPIWTFQATVDPGPGYNNWWEGNVVMGFDGTLYAGNTNWNYYAFTQEGALRWTYTTGSNAWSAASLADDGTLYWGSLDIFIHAVHPDGSSRWKTPTLGFVASSAAIGSDGTVYIGSFDSALYALDPATGKPRWQFPTTDHVYSSPALGSDPDGNTRAVYFGSADGTLYALNTQGGVLWTYDTGDTIRSSPALGPAPEEDGHDIVYFGCGNGKLYALDSDTGTRRWSFDTTPDDPELRDRNDLNASPALGLHGVYIGGEHGYVWYVPYDYCLNHAEDKHCDTDPGETFLDDIVEMYYVTPGGNTQMDDPETIPAASVITTRLVVREAGETVDASVCTSPLACPSEVLDIDVWPPLPFRAEPSGDGHFVHIVPDGFLEPGELYHVVQDGAFLTGGLRIGNLVIGGKRSGSFSDYLEIRASPPGADQIPLSVSDSEVTALEWKRLAAPLPPMMPSLNQIGFDSYHWILGTLEKTEPDDRQEGRFLMWAIGGTFNSEGILVPDPATDFTFPMNGRYKNDFFILTNSHFTMEVTDVPVPFDIFQLRGQLGADLKVLPGASAYAEVECMTIPTFGPLMALAGLCSNVTEKLVAVGTYLTEPYSPEGKANLRPEGVSVSGLGYTAPTATESGQVSATLSLTPGTLYPAARHVAAIVLVDPSTTTAVNLDYHENLSVTADPDGNLTGVTLNLPAGTPVPALTKAVVVLDVFPLATRILGE